MNLEIERPVWGALIDVTPTGNALLNTWFRNMVEPRNKLLREGVEVSGLVSNLGAFIKTNVNPTHSALLINIQPIKKKSREERLVEFLEHWLSRADWKLPGPFMDDAKALLGESK